MRVIELSVLQWVLFLFYGHPNLPKRQHIWQDVKSKLSPYNQPFAIVRDFNQILNDQDRLSFCNRPPTGSHQFRSFLSDLGLPELQHQGVWFTWTNSRSGSHATFERLDRAFVTQSWLQLFPNAMFQNLPIIRSDHSPLILDKKHVPKQKPRILKFESF